MQINQKLLKKMLNIAFNHGKNDMGDIVWDKYERKNLIEEGLKNGK